MHYGDANNYGDILISMGLDGLHNTLFCEEKYKSSDCFNEYYNMKMITDQAYYNKHQIRLFVHVSGQPDTIITHSPQFYPIELMCFIGGLISMWTGFSVFALWNYGEQLLGKKQTQTHPIKSANFYVQHHNIKKIFFVNKKTKSKLSTSKKFRKFFMKKKFC